ncbi:MAG: HPP family protein [archaeon]
MQIFAIYYGDVVLKNIEFDFKRTGNSLKNMAYFGGIIAIILVASFFLLTILLDISDYGISLATIGASIYIIFSDNKNSSYKQLYGAYAIAVACGFAALITKLPKNIECVLAFLLTIFALFMLNIKHTPAVGFAVTAVLNQFKLPIMLLALACIFILFFIAKSAKNIITNPKKYFIEIENQNIHFKIREKELPKYVCLKVRKRNYA